LRLGRRLSAATSPTNPFAEPHSTRPEILQAAPYRAARNPGDLRDCHYPTPASGAGFTGRKQAPIPLIQERIKGSKRAWIAAVLIIREGRRRSSSLTETFPRPFVAFLPTSRVVRCESPI